MSSLVEERVRESLAAQDATAAAVTLIEGYGSEILDFLHAICRTDADAEDVFSGWCERVLLKLPTFEWRSLLRTWAYRVARNLARSNDRAAVRRHEWPISEVPEIAAVARSTTADYLRTTVKGRLDQLRAELDDEERSLLVLRVERRLSWKEIAEIVALEGEVDEDAVAARLRKRFERIKARLRDELAPLRR